jgi:NAD(P)H dehydrogenase (quinone)
VKAKLFRVKETLSNEVLEKMHAPIADDNDPSLPPILDPKDLANADGILFGAPTRFGGFCAQMRALFDATGGLWMSGALAGKPAGLFCSVGTQGGGSETTLMTALPYLAHHGMIFVPIGYTAGPEAMTGLEEVRGGNPWGATTYAGGDGSRQPSAAELALAKHQGAYFAGVVKRLGPAA